MVINYFQLHTMIRTEGCLYIFQNHCIHEHYDDFQFPHLQLKLITTNHPFGNKYTLSINTPYPNIYTDTIHVKPKQTGESVGLLIRSPCKLRSPGYSVTVPFSLVPAPPSAPTAGSWNVAGAVPTWLELLEELHPRGK